MSTSLRNLACPSLRGDPDDVLRRVLDVIGLSVHTVLRVDLQVVGVAEEYDGSALCRFSQATG